MSDATFDNDNDNLMIMIIYVHIVYSQRQVMAYVNALIYCPCIHNLDLNISSEDEVRLVYTIEDVTNHVQSKPRDGDWRGRRGYSQACRLRPG